MYNTINQLTDVYTRDALGTVISHYNYGLTATGRRETIIELDGRTTAYCYDALYRLVDDVIFDAPTSPVTEGCLTDTTGADYRAHYDYDWVGNRTFETVDGVSTSYSYDDNDRLTQTGGTSYAYDNNGNTLSETLDGNVKTYTWDGKNKLTSLDNAGAITTYTYNHSGIRSSKTEAGTTTHFILDENRDYAQVLEEVVDNNAIVTYRYGHDLINQDRAGTVSYYHYDGLGSTRHLSDSLGSLTDSYDYEAFGETLSQTGSTVNNYLFTGEQLDASLSQYYLRARYYDQGVGRFTQMDTWMGNNQDPITLHKYLYANAEPANLIDPSGKFSIGSLGVASNIQAILGASAAAAAGVSLTNFSSSASSFDTPSPRQSFWILLAAMAGTGSNLLDLVTDKLGEDTSGSIVMYHGASVDSLAALLGGAPLSANAATELKYPGESSRIGFYLTPELWVAQFFGQRRGGNAVQVTFTTSAYQAISAGSVIQDMPPIGASSQSPGLEMIVLPVVFPLFDELRLSGQITITPTW
ncbi:RHS repeat-associated core domain-containing protein [Agarilytica rhodophyticola]|uniref:RHS repeat-associated core domain-containing protein n=1 Tax=Agarilytica rhodophyticola TaxID=1737490 RepID=UPI001FE861A7|nr:RHS repeat-associated core domain-containing protein [Agarilytica rhodophyticola]